MKFQEELYADWNHVFFRTLQKEIQYNFLISHKLIGGFVTDFATLNHTLYKILKTSKSWIWT